MKDRFQISINNIASVILDKFITFVEIFFVLVHNGVGSFLDV